jgi:hypothetical protein
LESLRFGNVYLSNFKKIGWRHWATPIAQLSDYEITHVLAGCLPVYGIDAPVDNLPYLP